MARPEHHDDIELEQIEIARIQVESMGVDPELLLGYAAFLKSMTKAGATIKSQYGNVTITREPNADETKTQLESKQSSWDERQKQYEIYAAVGKCEYEYQDRQAQRHAEEESLPWPPVTEPIESVDVTISKIEELTA